MLVVGSKVKEFNKAKGCLTSGNLADALSKKVEEILTAACQRCKDNGRSTVKPYDL